MNRPTSYYRARAGSDDPLFSGEGSQASRGKDEGREAKKSGTAAGYPGLPGVPGLFRPHPPGLEGGEGGCARVGYSDPGICGGDRL